MSGVAWDDKEYRNGHIVQKWAHSTGMGPFHVRSAHFRASFHTRMHCNEVAYNCVPQFFAMTMGFRMIILHRHHRYL